MLQQAKSRTFELRFLTLSSYSHPTHRSIFIFLTLLSLVSLLYIVFTTLRLHFDFPNSKAGWTRVCARHVVALRVSAGGGCSIFNFNSISSSTIGTSATGITAASIPMRSASAPCPSASISKPKESKIFTAHNVDVQSQKPRKEVHFIIGSLSDQLRQTLCAHPKIECISQSSILKLATTAIRTVSKHRARRVSKFLN